MKNAFVSSVSFLKKDLVFFLVMGISFLFYGLFAPLDLVLVIVLFLLLLANIDTNKIFYSYFACIFFEPVLNLPFIGGTFFRLFYVLMLVRFIIDIIKKTKYKFDVPTILLALVFVVTSVFYSISLSRNISVVMNVVIVLYIMLSLKKQENYRESIGELLTFIAVFAALSGIYGLSRGFMNEARTYMRLFGTIDDSNYSALFYTIGLFASFGATMLKKKWMKIVLIVIIACLLISTASIAGFAVAFLLLVIYFFFTQGYKKGLLLLLAIAIIFSAVLFIPSNGDGILAATHQKVHRFITFTDPNPEFRYQYPGYTDFELYLNRISSKRYYLTKTYAIHFIYNTPINEQLFGGNNPVEGDFRSLVPVRDAVVSHNTYLDMFFMMGLIGTFLALLFILINLIKHYISFLKTKDIRMLCLVFVMLTVLLFSISISTFPFRYSIAFMLM